MPGRRYFAHRVDMVDDDLTGPECRVRTATKNGDRVDFRDPEHPELEGVASGATWGPERSLRAGVLIELVTTERRTPEQQPRALRFAGAKIIDALDLEGLMLFVLWCPGMLLRRGRRGLIGSAPRFKLPIREMLLLRAISTAAWRISVSSGTGKTSTRSCSRVAEH